VLPEEDPCEAVVEEDEFPPPASWASVVLSVNKASTSEAKQIREMKTREYIESMDECIFPGETMFWQHIAVESMNELPTPQLENKKNLPAVMTEISFGKNPLFLEEVAFSR
jgi:hypothetical protein